MIAHFLALGRTGTVQSSPGINQIGSVQKKLAIQQKILLLKTYAGVHILGCGVAEQAQDAQGVAG
jgi:hypothetical protein